jgi:hypothetical protein
MLGVLARSCVMQHSTRYSKKELWRLKVNKSSHSLCLVTRHDIRKIYLFVKYLAGQIKLYRDFDKKAYYATTANLWENEKSERFLCPKRNFEMYRYVYRHLPLKVLMHRVTIWKPVDASARSWQEVVACKSRALFVSGFLDLRRKQQNIILYEAFVL